MYSMFVYNGEKKGKVKENEREQYNCLLGYIFFNVI